MDEASASDSTGQCRFVAVASLTALPAWLALSREQRGELISVEVEPVLAAHPSVVVRWVDVEAFTADCSDLLIGETSDLTRWYGLIEAIRDTSLFSRPLFRLERVVVGIEEGFRAYEAAQR